MDISDSQKLIKLHKSLNYLSATFLSLFPHPLAYTNSTILMDAKQWALTFFYLSFQSLSLFIVIVPLKKLIIIFTKFLIPYFLHFNITIKNMLHQVQFSTHCIITHRLARSHESCLTAWSHIFWSLDDEVKIAMSMAQCLMLCSWVLKRLEKNLNVNGSIDTYKAMFINTLQTLIIIGI